MADFPYTPNPAAIKRFLSHVQSAGVPEKITQKYLEKVGFKSTNDRYIIGVPKSIGLIDASGVPTQLWQSYRNRKAAGATLATALRTGYSDLFRTYPDAYRKDSERPSQLLLGTHEGGREHTRPDRIDLQDAMRTG